MVGRFAMEAVGVAEQDRDGEGGAVRKGQHPLQAYNSLASMPASEIANTVEICTKQGFDMVPLPERMLEESLCCRNLFVLDQTPRKIIFDDLRACLSAVVIPRPIPQSCHQDAKSSLNLIRDRSFTFIFEKKRGGANLHALHRLQHTT